MYIALNASSKLTGVVGVGVTTVPVTAGTGTQFAVGSNHSYVTFQDATNKETCKITGQSGDNLTVVRTKSLSWAIGTVIECRPCAEAMADYAVAPQIDGSIAAALADTDNLGFSQTSVAGALKKITWANAKATFYSSLGALIAAGTGKSTPVGGDSFAISDSAASGATKTLTFTNFWGMAITWAGKHIFTSTMKVQQSLEKITITAAAPAATQNFDWLTQAIQYFTTAGANNWTLNVRGDAGTSLDSLMAVGESVTLTVMATMTGTPYYENAFQIDGNAVTPKWIGGTAPSSGDASCINLYTYTIIKTAASTFTVIASKAKTS